MKKLIFGLVLALLPQIALAEYILKGPHTTVETDGSQTDGSVNLITKNAGPINFYTNNVLRSSISSTGATSYADSAQLGPDTSDGADNQYISINGGGGNIQPARGASMLCAGNEEATYAGQLRLSSGNIAGSFVVISAPATNGAVYISPNSADRWTFESDGDLANEASNGGDVSLNRSGTTLRVQEGTAASACMGVGTPNGNTPVAISTTCAVSGARIFYTRLGAITNMGVITTTTAPSGTGFSFASTGASDTGAGTVYWLIIKEAP